MLFSVYYRLNEAEGVSERASMILPSGSDSAFNGFCRVPAVLIQPVMSPSWDWKGNGTLWCVTFDLIFTDLLFRPYKYEKSGLMEITNYKP